MSRYSWTKESRALDKKLNGKKKKKKKKKKKAIIYKENDFGFISEIKNFNISIIQSIN